MRPPSLCSRGKSSISNSSLRIKSSRSHCAEPLYVLGQLPQALQEEQADVRGRPLGRALRRDAGSSRAGTAGRQLAFASGRAVHCTLRPIQEFRRCGSSPVAHQREEEDGGDVIMLVDPAKVLFTQCCISRVLGPAHHIDREGGQWQLAWPLLREAAISLLRAAADSPGTGVRREPGLRRQAGDIHESGRHLRSDPIKIGLRSAIRRFGKGSVMSFFA